MNRPETSTPRARAFVDALLGSANLRGVDYSLTSRELRAIVSGEDLLDLTKPMSEPFPDVSRVRQQHAAEFADSNETLGTPSTSSLISRPVASLAIARGIVALIRFNQEIGFIDPAFYRP